MPKQSSPSPTITPMNPIKPHPQTLTLAPDPALTLAPDPALTLAQDDDDDLLRSYHLHSQSLLIDDDDDPPPPHHFSSFLFRSHDDDEDEPPAPAPAPEEHPNDDQKPTPDTSSPSPLPPRINPSSHISSQFYTFNRDSHSLMVRCILESRLATPDEIRSATPHPVLSSWRSVWKDRNEDTAYLTAWKRIQDKLQAHLDSARGTSHLYFKNNPNQCVPHVDQWQDIVASSHADPDLLRHLGMRETVDRIKQAWTVGAKFYGIPESFIRVCVSSCSICSSSSSAGNVPASGGSGVAGSGSKRRRFEYTESIDVPAREVPQRLQQLAHKHKVVLCIRQKYIRYKPFTAEVKDYACHRAGDPSSASSSAKKTRVLKREPYQSKRCGCAFRIRAIVPIANYNDKDKTFVYEEEGTAVFKLYAVHSGHEPGPLDGSARIIHRMVGQKGSFDLDPIIYGVREDIENESFVNLLGKDDNDDAHQNVLQQVQELRVEAGLLEGKISKMSPEFLGSLSRELSDVLHRLRSFGGRQDLDEVLMEGDNEVGHWADDHNHQLVTHDRVFNKDAEIIEEENDFGSSLRNIVSWERMTADCQDRKMLMGESCKPNKWMMKEDYTDFDGKSILHCDDEEDSKLIKPLRHDGTIVSDPHLVGIQVDGFYPDNTKWYDSPGGLDPSADPGEDGFRHDGIV